VADGGIAFEGGLPFNTMGGYLSFGQVAQGLYNLQEVVDQIHGPPRAARCGSSRPASCMAMAAPACHSVFILTKEPTR